MLARALLLFSGIVKRLGDTRLLFAAAALALEACVPGQPEADEAEPVWNYSSVEQGLVSCSSWQDTGYRNGSAVTITLVIADGKPVELDTANAYAVMQADAARAGVNLVVVSGFRTMAEQQYLYGCYVTCSCNNCNLAARPGYSNHQSGYALDLNTSAPGVFTWLAANAGRYGFTRTVPSEPWHWEWWGGGPGGGPCGNTADNCTRAEAEACGGFGCGCADGQCSGGFCPGTGCTGKQTSDCAKVGCGCVDETCSGGLCPGTGCTARQTLDCQGMDAGCSMGRCVSANGDVAAMPDAGAPFLAPEDGGFMMVPLAAGGSPSPEPQDVAPPEVSSVTPSGGGAVTGGCAAVPQPSLLWVLGLLVRRRRTQRPRAATVGAHPSSRSSSRADP